MFISKKQLSRRTVLQGLGATVALPLLDAMVPAGTAFAKTAAAPQDPVRVHRDGARRGGQHEDRHREEHVVAGGGRPRLRPDAERAQPARALPRSPHHHQQHRRPQRRGVRGARDRRRSLPLERGVPHADAPAADAGLGRARRHVARSALRAEVRAGDGDSVAAALHRERRSGGRLLVRLLVRLHRLDQLGGAGSAAADGARPARGLRRAVRRRRHAAGSRRAALRGSQHPRLDRPGRVEVEEHARQRRSRAPERLSRRHPRDRTAACSASRRRTAAASRASCPARPLACPTRSKSTSS